MAFSKSKWVVMALVGALGLTLLGTSAATADEAQWLVDFEKAKELAKKEGKDLLVDFTGSDWCSFCIKLDNNVFSKDVFAKEIPEKFVLLKVDNPRDKSKQSQEEQKMVKELIAKYNISGFPTILLMDAEGRPYTALVGYDGTAAEKYVDNLLKKQSLRKKRDELLAKAKQVEGAERAKLLDEAIKGIDAELAVDAYSDIIDEIIKADADNEAGLKKKYTDLRSKIAFKSKLQKLIAGIQGPNDLPRATKELEQLISDSNVTGEARQEGLFYLAQFQFNTDRKKSKATLEDALNAAPDSPMAGQIRQILKRFFNDAPKKGGDEKKKQ